MGIEAGHIGEYFEQLKGNNWAYSEKKEKYGVLTTNARKNMFVQIAKRYLGIDDSMRYAEPFASGNPFQLNLTAEMRASKVQGAFNEQLSRFKKIVYQPQLAHMLPKVTYSGKTDAENKVNPRFQDDLVMSWLIGMYFGDLFLQKQLPGVPYEMFI